MNDWSDYMYRDIEDIYKNDKGYAMVVFRSERHSPALMELLTSLSDEGFNLVSKNKHKYIFNVNNREVYCRHNSKIL